MSEEYLKNQKRIAKLEMKLYNFTNEVIELDKKDDERIKELEVRSAAHTENEDGLRRHLRTLEKNVNEWRDYMVKVRTIQQSETKEDKMGRCGNCEYKQDSYVCKSCNENNSHWVKEKLE